MLIRHIRRYKAIHSLHIAQNQSRFQQTTENETVSPGGGHVWRIVGGLLATVAIVGLVLV